MVMMMTMIMIVMAVLVAVVGRKKIIMMMVMMSVMMMVADRMKTLMLVTTMIMMMTCRMVEVALRMCCFARCMYMRLPKACEQHTDVSRAGVLTFVFPSSAYIPQPKYSSPGT